MPKRRVPTYDTKPKAIAHPSLTSSGKNKDAHSLVSSGPTSGDSVNDRIRQLRLNDGGPSAGRGALKALNPNTNPSLPPSLRNLLQLEDTPPPRPRSGLRITGRTRGLAGPVPPSWLHRDPTASRRAKVKDTSRYADQGLQRLPGSYVPERGSLLETALKGLAKNWAWHTVYDQFYLATLPVRYKETLLFYVSHYNPHMFDRIGLKLLFLDETELEGGTGADGLTHLDFSKSIGVSFRLLDIKDLFTAKRDIAFNQEREIEESWDNPQFTATPSNLPRFHTLTHLSLSQPRGLSIWKGLLDLIPHMQTLTHLALAYWPPPTLSPNSNTAYREMPQGSVSYGASNYYSAYDNDWSEAGNILRRLGKSTYCLKWLDLTGCYPWVLALASENIDWCGTWQGLETVLIGQGWIPDCFHAGTDDRIWREIFYEARLIVPTARSAALKEWANVESNTLKMEDSVNSNIMAFNREIPSQQNDDHDDWSRGTFKRKPQHRSTRIMFERGWEREDYRITDALHVLAGGQSPERN